MQQERQTQPGLPPMTPGPITTPLTAILGCQHPILLAGMAEVSGGRLAAAVANAGGFSVVGGYQCTPDQLHLAITDMKSQLRHPDLPFGVAVAIPQRGGTARKTNRDVSRGCLDELIAVTIRSGARLFVTTAGAAPAPVIAKLHAAGVLVMNLVGHPRHAVKALDAGVDIVCAQGKEGRGHTGEVPSSILVPAVVAVARRYNPPMLRGGTALVVAGGGVADGAGLAGALVQGAAGVWVCTRFVASEEASASEAAKRAIVECPFGGTERTLVLTGRPLRMRTNEYVRRWQGREEEVRRLCARGVVPMEEDKREGREVEVPVLMGEVAGAITDIRPAGKIVENMVREAAEMLNVGKMYLSERAKF